MTTFCLDANTLETAWCIRYPRHVFLSLWAEIAKNREHFRITESFFVTDEEVLEEDRVSKWLRDNDFKHEKSVLYLDGEVSREALKLAKEYRTKSLSTGGADTNGMTLIAYAKLYNLTVVTFEAKQLKKIEDRPGDKSKYKIPLICYAEDVRCITFIEMLEALNIQI